MRFFIFLTFLMMSALHATGFPHSIATSADGTYEVRAVATGGSELFGLEIWDRSSKRKLADIKEVHPAKYGSDHIAYWHPERPVVAIRTFESRRFGKLRIFSLESGKLRELAVQLEICPSHSRS